MKIIKSLDELEKDITEYDITPSEIFSAKEQETNVNIYTENDKPILKYSSSYSPAIRWAIKVLKNKNGILDNIYLTDDNKIASISITTTSQLISFKGSPRKRKSQSMCFTL